jgi:putative Mg2+ transporter-C (MgtC) family protein
VTSLLRDPTGLVGLQLLELGAALVLSALIGLERELRRRSAGLRTHTLIGFGAALIMLVSKYGFDDVAGPGVSLDPSRVAAQIVSGIGFIGGGLIFVKRDAVRGLTTAAAVWLTTAVGMAAGAGLLVLAVATTAGYFVVVYGFTPLTHRIQRSRIRSQWVELTYRDGRGLLRDIVAAATALGWVVANLDTRHYSDPGHSGAPAEVSVMLELRGTGEFATLASALSEIDGVQTVHAVNADAVDDPDAE